MYTWTVKWIEYVDANIKRGADRKFGISFSLASSINHIRARPLHIHFTFLVLVIKATADLHPFPFTANAPFYHLFIR